MPDYESTHSESWALNIKRNETDDWPDVPVPYRRPGSDQLMRISQIHVSLHRGNNRPGISVIGCRLKKDGTPGQQRVTYALYNATGWEWVREAVEAARKFANLGPGVTGVDW